MKNTNWRAMQVIPQRETGKLTTWLKPGDVNVKAMSMGSWRHNQMKGTVKK